MQEKNKKKKGEENENAVVSPIENEYIFHRS